MSRIHNVLFLCTGNTARSIMGEALLNHYGGSRFRAFSAGSHPKGHVHRLTLERLAFQGVPTNGLRSKSWDEFAVPDAPAMDIVITVCDSAASEICPIWPGSPVSAHWGITDPAEFGPDRQPEAFAFAFDAMKRRVDRLLGLSLDDMDEKSLARRLREVGQAEAAVG